MRNLVFVVVLLLVLPVCYGETIDSSRMTAADLEAFLEGVIPLQLQREDIAGAVITVVKNGEVIFAKGYGYADVQKRKPVSPELTLFRPGSVSKLFIWTSIMQLVEQGKLDLDRDVNTYIDFKIPANYSKPISVRNLMTHTPGLEETAKDLFVAEQKNLQPLKQYLPSHLPNQIFPPGQTSAYSNYGTALAGYILERLSGRTHADYVREFIFKPLGMEHSTFEQPLPKTLEPLMSKGYNLGSDEPQPFELVNAAPAGSLSSTGNDMAKFMLAFLNHGQFGTGQILKPETVTLMHTKQFALHPKANGMALGFYEESSHGLRILGHGGDTQYFHSDLHIIPDANVGFFISYNSAGKGEISGRDAVWKAFLDRYFPYNPPEPKTQPTAKQHSMEVSGTYQVSRREQTTIFRLLYKMLGTKVSAQPDGTIQVAGFDGMNKKPKRWHEVEPFVYQEVNGQEQIFFIKRNGGDFEMVIRYPFMSFEKATFFDTSLFLQILSGFSAVILLLTILLWPVAAWTRRHYKKPLILNAGEMRLRMLTRFVCILILTFLITFTLIVVSGFQNISVFSSGNDMWFRFLNFLGLIGVAGTFVVFYNAFRTLQNPERGFWPKLVETAIALACVGFVWIMIAGKLLIFNLNY